MSSSAPQRCSSSSCSRRASRSLCARPRLVREVCCKRRVGWFDGRFFWRREKVFRRERRGKPGKLPGKREEKRTGTILPASLDPFALDSASSSVAAGSTIRKIGTRHRSPGTAQRQHASVGQYQKGHSKCVGS
eukprot:1536033-Rhodomonas_salina.1